MLKHYDPVRSIGWELTHVLRCEVEQISLKLNMIQGPFNMKNFLRTHINNHFYSLKEPAKDNLIQIYKIYPPYGYQCQKCFGLRPSLKQLLEGTIFLEFTICIR